MFSNYKFYKIALTFLICPVMTGCAIFEKKDTDQESNWLVRQFEKDGCRYANQATVAYSQGDFKKALELALDALKDNPRNQQGLLVGALSSEKLGRFNRARQYYEDLILIDGSGTSILGSSSGTPEKISEIAKKRLRMIAIKQSELVVENKKGAKVFNISAEAGAAQSKATISKALNKKTPAKAQPQVGNVFTPQEQNMVSRFIVLKELAEKDLITKEEFLTRRQANIGALLPLTNQAPGIGIDQPVPSPDLIIERINVLKEAVENRAITPREFSAERDVIIEALLPPSPRERMRPKAPSKNILGAAKDLRKLEVLYDLNLITSGEKTAEQKQVERYLGINRAPAVQNPIPAKKIEVKVEENAVPKAKTINTIEKAEAVEVIQPGIVQNTIAEVAIHDASAAQNPAPQNIIPNVSSPF